MARYVDMPLSPRLVVSLLHACQRRWRADAARLVQAESGDCSKPFYRDTPARVEDAQKCHVLSAYLIPLFDAEQHGPPFAVVEICQTSEATAYALVADMLQSCLQVLSNILHIHNALQAES